MAINEESFSKVIHIGDMSSDNMRAIPLDFVRRFSDSELLGKMKITAKWGTTWEVEICKNPGFFYMGKDGWNRFVRDNSLGCGDLLTFTHKGAMCFTVNIYKEMLQPPQPTALLASLNGNMTEEQGEGLSKDVNKKAKTNGGRKYKRKLEEVDSIQRDSGGSSSSTVARFTLVIRQSYLNGRLLGIKQIFAKNHMPKTRATFKIHHPDKKKTWTVCYLPRNDQCVPGKWSPCFSAGWTSLAKEYPLAIGYICTFTFIKPDELLLVVTKSDVEERRCGCEGVSQLA